MTKRFQNLHGTKLVQSGTKNLSARPVSFALKTGNILGATTCNVDGRTRIFDACSSLIAQRLVPIFRIAPNLFLRTRERKMAPRERISIGPFEAEGPRTTRYIVIIGAAALAAAFYLGKLSALFDSCFGIKF